tara:strand:- start:4286 stop:5239 length:954 start_codon:yes stop_codon:yes gene_type:complete
MAKKSTPIEPKSLADFNKAIADFAKEVKVEVSIITNEQMRLMLRDAMIFTPPMLKGGGQGLSPKALTAGMGKLAKDVKRIFIPMDDNRRAKPVFLRQVVASIRNNKWFSELNNFKQLEPTISSLSPVMRKIIQDSDPRRAELKAKNYLNKASADGSIRPILGPTNELRGIHERYKGKVGGRWPKNAPVGGPQYMVGTALYLQAYIAERQLKVGYTKAGWAAALRLIPPLISSKGNARNVGVYDAPWVDRNMTAMGQFSMTKTPTGTSMTATNLIGNINNVATEANTVNIVYGNRVKQINATVQGRTRDATDRANRKK